MIGGGAVALGAPSSGLLATIFGMTRSFAVLKESGVSDPKLLADAVGQTLVATASGLFIGGMGLVVFLGGLIVWLAQRSGSTPPPLSGEGPHS